MMSFKKHILNCFYGQFISKAKCLLTALWVRVQRKGQPAGHTFKGVEGDLSKLDFK